MSTSGEYDYLLKVVMVGDSGVGKSSLLKRFASREFTGDYISTIGVDFEIKTLEIDGKTVKLQIWDTAGQERFQNITTSYYRGAHCIILVYDITQLETFEHVHKWHRQIQEHSNNNVQILLVGNKSDLQENRQVPYEDAETMAQQLGISVFETSAKDSTNVDQAFYHIASQAIQNKVHKITRTKADGNVKLDGKDVGKDANKKGGCCLLM